MARISGIDIPKEKRGVVALTYIFGIGSSRAKKILTNANVSEEKKVLIGVMRKQLILELRYQN